MPRLPRQLVSCLTAAFVLACNVLCACGGHSPAAGDDHHACHQTCEPEPARTHSHSHCAGHHGHHDHHRQDGGEQEQPAPQPCGGGDPNDHNSGCQHCNQIVAVPNTKAKASDDAASRPCLAGFLPPLSVGQPSDPGCLRLPVLAGDLPPPIARPTLLSLHCALTL